MEVARDAQSLRAPLTGSPVYAVEGLTRMGTAPKTVPEESVDEEHTSKLLEELVSRLGLEPRTLALKGQRNLNKINNLTIQRPPMADKDLQRLINSVDDIGHGQSLRHSLLARRNHITQKVKVAGQRTLYLSVHDDEQPAEIFLRVKGADCSAELIGLYDVIARLMSLALQYGAPP